MTIIHKSTQAISFVDGKRLLLKGRLEQIALAVKQCYEQDRNCSILVFDAVTSHVIDLDVRGSDAEILARLAEVAPSEITPDVASAQTSHAPETAATEIERGRGRPKLGVVPREVTLLPRHWEWLNQQTGGASVALRKLVEEARRQSESKQQARLAAESSYRFMAGLAGDQINYEEASRALFAGDGERFASLITTWPVDIAQHLLQLAQPVFYRKHKNNHDY